MTGFALLRRQTSAGELNCSLRAVNHRGLDIHFHQSGELAAFENAMRALIKQRVMRGHVDVRAWIERRDPAESTRYDQRALSHYIKLFRQACDDFGLDSKPDLSTLLALPGVVTAVQEAGADPFEKAFEAELIAALATCLEELNACREREGEALRTELEAILGDVEGALRSMSGIREKALPHFQIRLRERLAELLNGAGLPEARIVEEAALLADKSDVQEELTRLTVHTEEVRRMLRAGGEVGKRLDFLLQEMNRETNTTLAKTRGAGEPGLGITDLALGIKANIERMREQALNLE